MDFMLNHFSYGYEGDDEWQEYSPISSCFSCTSYNGDNMACERPGIEINLYFIIIISLIKMIHIQLADLVKSPVPTHRTIVVLPLADTEKLVTMFFLR